jgi:hypothetical protein
MSLTHLDPPLPMPVLDKGDGYAMAIIDPAAERLPQSRADESLESSTMQGRKIQC